MRVVYYIPISILKINNNRKTFKRFIAKITMMEYMTETYTWAITHEKEFLINLCKL